MLSFLLSYFIAKFNENISVPFEIKLQLPSLEKGWMSLFLEYLIPSQVHYILGYTFKDWIFRLDTALYVYLDMYVWVFYSPLHDHSYHT